MGIHFQRRAARQRHFTLIELLAAMAVLVLLMFTLFRFFGSAQKVWSVSETNARIYENARIAFEVITRDLQSAVASSRDGQKIPFYVWPTAGTTYGEVLSFVSCAGSSTGSTTDLCEVVYAFSNNEFRRARDFDSNNGNANWDFFTINDPFSATFDWYTAHNTLGPLQRVMRGVTDLSFTCLDSTGAVMSGPYNKLPASVLVSLTLVDEKLVNAPDPVKNKTKRTFTKTIFLGSRQ